MPIDRILQELLCDLPTLISAQCRLSCKIDQRRSAEPDLDDPRTNAPIDRVIEQRSKDAERLKSLLDKSKIVAASSTLAASVFFAGAGQVVPLSNSQLLAGYWLHYFLAVSLIATSVYLILAGFLALRALGVQETFELDVEDDLGNEDIKLHTAKQIRCLDLNRLANLRVANLVHASHKAVRNGLFSMVILILVITLSILITAHVNKGQQTNPKGDAPVLKLDQIESGQ
ncbi:MAG: hypothetical protein RBT76_15800 [candidate division Zixibacteria bacterium]|jgi:hypothetical protein|nr:hypothetical protein [candidate division Zixibacteria bacterium]